MRIKSLGMMGRRQVCVAMYVGRSHAPERLRELDTRVALIYGYIREHSSTKYNIPIE